MPYICIPLAVQPEKSKSVFGHSVTTPIEYFERNRLGFHRKSDVPKFGSYFESSLILALTQNMPKNFPESSRTFCLI
jgi:hypothetical protein